MIEYRDGTGFVEDVPLEHIAQRTGTPVFVYSAAHFTRQYHALTSALSGLDHRIYYSVKANSNLSVMRLFQSLGAGFDIVSGGELERALKVGAPPEAIIFSGVGKRVEEIDFALKLGIGCFNVESAAELDRIADRAKILHRTANIALRINPDIDAQTHPYISTGLKENKFGVPIEQALELYTRASQNSVFNVIGIDCHIGSQIAEARPLLEAELARLESAGNESWQIGVLFRLADLELRAGNWVEASRRASSGRLQRRARDWATGSKRRVAVICSAPMRCDQ